MLKRNYLLIDLGTKALDYEDNDKVKEVIYQVKIEDEAILNHWLNRLRKNDNVVGVQRNIGKASFDSNVVISKYITLGTLLELL